MTPDMIELDGKTFVPAEQLPLFGRDATPYYSTVDATPLWLMLYAEYYAWGNSPPE